MNLPRGSTDSDRPFAFRPRPPLLTHSLSPPRHAHISSPTLSPPLPLSPSPATHTAPLPATPSPSTTSSARPGKRAVPT
ncbi:hypothetical protein E2C01_092665 [Portunus trituberculatus]|uniref:Uncharacterized protein n=1 Tax=Portunus trituberculatus TaxID=210409 RepID=A0A5B7JSC5_PORTR|nr:hypothetical protein [Portunus trituberculatus]